MQMESQSQTSTPNKTVKASYTKEDKKTFAALYILHGNVRFISQLMEVPEQTLYGWIKTDWWPSVYDEAKREFAEILEAKISGLVDKVADQLMERLELGDEVVTRTGDIVRVKVSARDLNNILRDGIDKIRLLQNKPTKLSAEMKVDLTTLEKNFADLADKYRDRIVSTQ